VSLPAAVRPCGNPPDGVCVHLDGTALAQCLAGEDPQLPQASLGLNGTICYRTPVLKS
jgi:hypothetical protein